MSTFTGIQGHLGIYNKADKHFPFLKIKLDGNETFNMEGWKVLSIENVLLHDIQNGFDGYFDLEFNDNAYCSSDLTIHEDEPIYIRVLCEPDREKRFVNLLVKG